MENDELIKKILEKYLQQNNNEGEQESPDLVTEEQPVENNILPRKAKYDDFMNKQKQWNSLKDIIKVRGK